jgi:hypothetical protein
LKIADSSKFINCLGEGETGVNMIRNEVEQWIFHFISNAKNNDNITVDKFKIH